MSATARRGSSAASTTSTPMPSPGMSATEYVCIKIFSPSDCVGLRHSA
ncbi:hypothetical protein ACFPRL_13640 [Pseudoclavibacter helvolus]